MRLSDWSSDVCSSDLYAGALGLAKDQKGNNDILALTQPQIVEEITMRYLDAGSDIVSTNTFSANRISQADYGAEHLVRDINFAAAQAARHAADARAAQDGHPNRKSTRLNSSH